jgi:hypothetical protein
MPVRGESAALTAIENTTPMKTTRASSVSQPIPVPSQAQNYEKMQETRDRTKSFGGVSAGSPYGSPYDGNKFTEAFFFSQPFLCSVSDRRPSLDRVRQASFASSSSDLANSLSPPAVRFTMDTTLVTSSQFSMPPAKAQTRRFNDECIS